MAILIDGYNLLHATGILGRNVGPGTLERARHALLRFLAASLADSERADTTVVFDASNSPPGLPHEQYHQGIRVLYAKGYSDADGLMEKLIRADSSPRRLVVVSSDHQVQRAARRRRGTAVDSDRWYADVCRQRRGRDAADGEASEADDRAKGRQPFFLYFALTSPHEPIVPSKEFQGKSGIAPIADFVMQTSWSAGQVVEAVDKAGLADDTVVVFTADNGHSHYTGWEQLVAAGHRHWTIDEDSLRVVGHVDARGTPRR